jgi:hypothetical protein
MRNATRLCIAVVAGSLLVGALAGCREKGPMEKAGEKIDDAGRSVKDAAKDAADKLKK